MSSIHIVGIEAIPVEVPRRRHHAMASMAMSSARHVVVRLLTDSEHVGLGEAPINPRWGGDHGRYYGEEAGATRHLLTDVLFPAIDGSDVYDVERLLEIMDRTIRGYPYAKAAIDMAVHDVIGKATGLSVAQLLGGAFRQSVPLAQSLGFMPTAQAVDEAVAAVGEGLRAIKIKVGVDFPRDIETVREVRAAVGPHVSITLDANQAYPSPKVAIRQIERLEAYGIDLIEQPVQGLREMAIVTASVNTPVMADESAWTARDVLEIATTRAADAISIYVTKPGGLFRAREMIAVAQAAGLPCNVNGSGELGIGNAANVQLAASREIVSLPCVFPISAPAEQAPTTVAGRQYVDDLVTKPMAYSEGSVALPEEPGLGVTLDPVKLERYRTDRVGETEE
ncbi:MAG TPA: enolase C-terminal domain-like protein [Candidatus Limnocylindria bacterium]|nr:enolase C-terminal domain-like protein [Candidatus Limnocylindria bacterium]